MKSRKLLSFATAMLMIFTLVSACRQVPDPSRTNITNTNMEAQYDYSAEEISLPDNINTVSDLCSDGESLFFIGHGNFATRLYTMRTDCSGIAELTDYEPPDSTRAISLCVGADGTLWTLEDNLAANTGSFPDGIGRQVIIRNLEKSGAEISRVDLSDKSYFYDYSEGMERILVDNDGRLHLFTSTGSQPFSSISIAQADFKTYYKVFETDGTEVFSMESSQNAAVLPNIRAADGKVYAAAMNYSLATMEFSVSILDVNIETRKSAEVLKTVGATRMFFDGDENYDVYLANGSELYAVNFADEITDFLLRLTKIGVFGEATAYAVLPDGEIIACVNTAINSFSTFPEEVDGDGTAEMYLLTPRERTSESDERTVVNVAVLGVNTFAEEIARFNQLSDEYIVEAVEYDIGYDLDTGRLDPDVLARFNAAIVSSSPPDIVLGIGTLSLDDYIGKGVFDDLYPYIDADEDFGGRGALLQNVLSAAETDGQLFSIPLSFTVSTAVGSKLTLGDRATWTMDEMLEMSARLPVGSTAMAYTTADTVLEFLMSMNYDSFIDWNTGECSFESDDFINLLEYTNLYPVTKPATAANSAIPDMLREGRALVSMVSYGSFYAFIADKIVLGDLTYIGYPCDDGKGSHLSLGRTASIISFSENKAGAWELISFMLNGENQAKVTGGLFSAFPVNRAAFEVAAAESTVKKFATDINGNETEQAKDNPYSLINMETIPVFALTREEADAYTAYIMSIDTARKIDYAIFNIINEEAQSLYAGYRTTAEAARIIQNRVTTYVNERR